MWLPPPSHSVSKQGYLPDELYELESAYGTKDELVTLNQALRAAGIRPMADIVINHRSAAQKGPDGKWNQYTYVKTQHWGDPCLLAPLPPSMQTSGKNCGLCLVAPLCFHRDRVPHPGLKVDWGPWAITGTLSKEHEQLRLLAPATH